jgi:hypothetical protein
MAVTNAVQATGVTEVRPLWSQLATIHVRLLLFEHSIVLAVRQARKRQEHDELHSPPATKPLLRGIALLGIAGAWVIGSHTWEPAIVIAVVAAGQTVYRYIWAGEDTDESALQGSRADERQKQVGLRARALSGSVAMPPPTPAW